MIIRIIIIVISRGRLSRTDGGGGGSVDDGVCWMGDEGVGRVSEGVERG